jgi:hypothetical protein
MNKGIVMETASRHLIVMTSDGQFVKLSRKSQSCRIGEEIHFSTPGMVWKKSSKAVVSSLIAAVLFGMIIFAGMGGFLDSNHQMVVAYVTVDINPSVEFGIDAEEKVIEAYGLNDDGKELLKHIDYKGKYLEEVSSALMTQADLQGYFKKYIQSHEGTIVITSTMMQELDTFDEEKVTLKVKNSLEHVIKEQHPSEAENFTVTSVPTPKEVREEAKLKGISTGKLAIELLSKGQKDSMSDEESKAIENLTIHEAAKQLRGIGKLIQSNKAETKNKLKGLLKAEQEKDKEDKKNLKKDGKDKDKDKENDKEDKKDKENNKEDNKEDKENNKEDNEKDKENRKNSDNEKQKSRNVLPFDLDKFRDKVPNPKSDRDEKEKEKEKEKENDNEAQKEKGKKNEESKVESKEKEQDPDLNKDEDNEQSSPPKQGLFDFLDDKLPQGIRN